MTTGPRLLSLDRTLVPGLIAVVLFAFMSAVFLTANGSAVTELGFDSPETFPDTSIVGAIGYALIGAAERGVENTENFLVALIMMGVLLDAALDGALMLAERDDGGDE
jgi:NADH-quinone oxidoreductase subunit J